MKILIGWVTIPTKSALDAEEAIRNGPAAHCSKRNTIGRKLQDGRFCGCSVRDSNPMPDLASLGLP